MDKNGLGSKRNCGSNNKIVEKLSPTSVGVGFEIQKNESKIGLK